MYPTGPDLRNCPEAYILPLEPTRPSTLSFDPRSHYAETFWLPILGPSTMWLLRKMAERFDTEPDGFTLDVADMSYALGIRSKGGRNNSFHRSVDRIVRFKMGHTVDDRTIAVLRQVPPLHDGHIRRLPPRLANLHDETIRQYNADCTDLHRSENVALALLGLGDSPDGVEQQLIRWGIGSDIAKAAVDRAWAAKARQDLAEATRSNSYG